MAERRRLFIYDRKEVGILILLGIGVALFAFTLGVHLGKQVIPKTDQPIAQTEEKSPESIEAAPVAPPNRTEISDEVKNVPGAVDEALDENLRDEIARTGLQVEKPKPLKLPEKTKAESSPARAGRSSGRYVIQVGSFTSMGEAEPELKKLTDHGLQGEIREVEIRGKGKWFRVVVGNYSSVAEAEKAGKTFKDEKRIGDFVVVSSSSTRKN